MAIQYRWGQDVIYKKTGERTHITGVGGGNRYILQNGANVYSYEIEAAGPEPKLPKNRWRRK